MCSFRSQDEIDTLLVRHFTTSRCLKPGYSSEALKAMMANVFDAFEVHEHTHCDRWAIIFPTSRKYPFET